MLIRYVRSQTYYKTERTKTIYVILNNIVYSSNLEASERHSFSPNTSLRGYSTVFDILDRGSKENETSYKNSENPEMTIYFFAPDQKWKKEISEHHSTKWV